MRDVYCCMAIANSDDPEAAIWKERAGGAEDMRQTRARRISQKKDADKQDNGVGRHPKSVQTALGLYRKMNAYDREKVRVSQEEIDQCDANVCLPMNRAE
jgi:hypothetical protein